MVTDYPHRMPPHNMAAEIDVHQADDKVGAIVVGLFDRVHQILCALHGHDSLLNFEHDRMFLKCASCGHESPGWALTEAPPKVRLSGDARRHVIMGPQLISERRIA